MVGALADWFAVVALFRHPLGLPIPHTAIITERKDQFGETMGDFVQTSFLTPEIITERVRAANVTNRLAAWLSVEENAERVARHAADASVTAADLLREDEVQHAIERAVRQKVEETPIAPMLGRGLELLTEGGRHQQVIDAVLRGLDRFLDDNHEAFRARFGAETPWWMPESLEDRIYDRMVEGARRLVHEVADDPDHELRREADARLRKLVDDLRSSDAMQERGEEIKRELLDHPELRAWVSTVWQDVKVSLRAQADDPSSELRRRLTEAVQSLGQRLRDDPALRQRADEAIETGVRYVTEQFHDEIAAMVSNTIARWDAQETSDRLELLLGPDLQYIRINGTVVGALAGLVIYSLAQLLG
jgi:uncharacterized membrane-anchored protein YjiN (DUF445 family)